MSKIERLQVLTMTMGVSGLILFVGGISSCFVGVSGKAVDKLAEVLKPHQPIIQKMINYGAMSSFSGVLLATGGALIAKTIVEKLVDEDLSYDVEENKCTKCSYYCDNEYLRCAVNPSLPPNCNQYEPKNKC